MIFLEGINSFLLERLPELFKNLESVDDVLLVFISKSGATKETVLNWDVLKTIFINRFTEKDLVTRTIVITSSSDKGPEGERFIIPEKVGGRFSVFSAVGLLPLSLAGIDIATILKRVQVYTADLFTPDLNSNPSLISALFAYSQHQEGRPTYDHFFFRSELSALGQWTRQLLAESLGKRHDIRLLPTVSLGSNDLHSSLQRTLGASADIATHFIWVPSVSGTFAEEAEREGEMLYQGTKKAYTAKGLQYIESLFDNFLDIGIFMQTKMVETMLLAKLFDVNAFDQPAVEEYKKIAH
jgi:glucose-6-phosphate isomerase